MKTKYFPKDEEPNENTDFIKQNLFAIYEIKDLKFEFFVSQKNSTTFTRDVPVKSISFDGGHPEMITINFDNIGHMHLSGKDLEAFMDGLNKVYNKILVKSFSYFCTKCDFSDKINLKIPKLMSLIKYDKNRKCETCGETLLVAFKS